MTVTLLVTEIEKIMDALVEHSFSGGIIKIAESGDRIFLRDKDDMLIASWQREVEEQPDND